MSTKYASDTHLMDVASLNWRRKLGLDLDKYLSYLTENWNTFTDPNDDVIIVGDLGYPCHIALNTLLGLNGHKVLVMGNHDVEWGSMLHTRGLFEDVVKYIYQDGLYIAHIPELPENITNVTYFVHGHHHQYEDSTMRGTLLRYANDPHRYNCAVDLNKHKPCTLQELMLNKAELIDAYTTQGYI